MLERVPWATFGASGHTDFSYRVGFLVFSGLESLMGEAELDRAMRQYVGTHMAKGGTTGDLVRIRAAAAPPWASGVVPPRLSGHRGMCWSGLRRILG